MTISPNEASPRTRGLPGGYGAGRVREGSTRSQERVVGRSAAGAAVGVAEEERALIGPPSAAIHAVRAIVNEGLNRDRIEPPQPTFSLFSQQLTADSFLAPATA